MIPTPAIAAAVDAVEASQPETLGEAIARRKKTGWRYLCSCCKSNLPGSNEQSKFVSHGLCNPPCDEAKRLGWGK